MHDITAYRKMQAVENEHKLLSLLTASVSHEMLTPIKCIVQMTKSLSENLKNGEFKYEAKLILSTTKLLMSQVKILLDKNLLDRDHFLPNIEPHSLNSIINETIEIMRTQSAIKHIQLLYNLFSGDIMLMIDKLRI